MTAPLSVEDGNLPATLCALEDAIHTLCGPQSHLLDGKHVYVPSLYLQLRDAVTGEQSNTGGGGGSKSRPPFWTDAFRLRDEIDQALEIWQPAFTGVPPTVGRLNCLQGRKWRPQDVRQINQIIEAVKEWVGEINGLLNPEPVAYLMAPDSSTAPAACTACGTKWVYRMDTSEERVRQPALKVTKDGCRCQHCRVSWEPGQLRMLAAALGYPLPSGVLE